MGSCTVVSKDARIPMPTDVRYSDRLNDIVSVVEPSDIPLTDVEFCCPSHGDPSTNHDTRTSIAVLCHHGWGLGTFLNSTPNPLPPVMKIENEFRLFREHSVGSL